MEFQDGENELRAIVSHKSAGDTDRLLERVDHVRLALERRATNDYQRQLIAVAVRLVIPYVEEGKPPGDDRRQTISDALGRLGNAGNF